eukprot:1541849-Prymnesium_polylepis.1
MAMRSYNLAENPMSTSDPVVNIDAYLQVGHSRLPVWSVVVSGAVVGRVVLATRRGFCAVVREPPTSGRDGKLPDWEDAMGRELERVEGQDEDVTQHQRGVATVILASHDCPALQVSQEGQ